MKNKLLSIVIAILVSTFNSSSFAQDNLGWFSRAHIGLSQLSDQQAQTYNIGSTNATADVALDSGFTSGLSIGYRYNSSLAAEFGWEYRSNGSSIELTNGANFEEGNYASNAFYLNGHYFFSKRGKWEPYFGAGFLWIQEIDIDLETGGSEQSFSDDGYTGYQFFLGANRALSENWALNLEARYSSISDIQLNAEDLDGSRIEGLDYDPVTLQVGAIYKF